MTEKAGLSAQVFPSIRRAQETIQEYKEPGFEQSNMQKAMGLFSRTLKFCNDFHAHLEIMS